jgi:hypothetical protein
VSEVEAHLQDLLDDADADVRRMRATLSMIVTMARTAAYLKDRTSSVDPWKVLADIAERAAAESEGAG